MKKIFNNSKKANVFSPIVLKSNQKTIFGSSGTIELRKGSKSGQLVESFDVSSDKVNISAREIIIQPSNPLPYETEIYVVMSNGFVISAINGSSFSGLDVNGDKQFKFVTEDPIGKPLEGGTVILKEESWYVVLSPENSELSLSWNQLSTAIQKTEEVTGTTGWYVPDYYEMQNYKNYLKTKKSYWTSMELNADSSYSLYTNSNAPMFSNKSDSFLVRTFKKVNF